MSLGSFGGCERRASDRMAVAEKILRMEGTSVLAARRRCLFAGRGDHGDVGAGVCAVVQQQKQAGDATRVSAASPRTQPRRAERGHCSSACVMCYLPLSE